MIRFLLGLLLLLPQVSLAKDMATRLGIGFRNSYAIDLPSVASIYYPNPDWGLVGALGIDTQTDNSKFAFSVGVRKLIFKEDNMNFFMGGNLGMISNEEAGHSSSGFELNGIVGGEFFFAGLDSLGFNFETGIGVDNADKVRFRTIADHFFRAGIFFYF
jgi:hypothetical protein